MINTLLSVYADTHAVSLSPFDLRSFRCGAVRFNALYVMNYWMNHLTSKRLKWKFSCVMNINNYKSLATPSTMKQTKAEWNKTELKIKTTTTTTTKRINEIKIKIKWNFVHKISISFNQLKYYSLFESFFGFVSHNSVCWFLVDADIHI